MLLIKVFVENLFDFGQFSWSIFFVENFFDQLFCQKCFWFFCFQKTLVYENLVWSKENFFDQTFCGNFLMEHFHECRKFPGSNILLKLCLIKHFVGNFLIKYFVENFLDQRKFLWLWNNPLSREFPWLWKNYFLDCKNNRSETILKQLRHEFWF